MKRYLVLGWWDGRLCTLVTEFDPGRPLEPQLKTYAEQSGFIDMQFGVTCVELAAAVGGVFG